MGCEFFKFRKRASVLVPFITALALAAFSQQQESDAPQFPPLRVDVSLVSLTATVVDKSDKGITGQDDFQVYEDGVLQNLVEQQYLFGGCVARHDHAEWQSESTHFFGARGSCAKTLGGRSGDVRERIEQVAPSD